MVRQVLLDAVDDLTVEDFKRFKFFLRENDILKGRKTLRRADLEKADRLDTVDLMVQTYKRDEALEMTKDILRRINRNDLVEICSSAAEADDWGQGIDAAGSTEKDVLKRSNAPGCVETLKRQPRRRNNGMKKCFTNCLPCFQGTEEDCPVRNEQFCLVDEPDGEDSRAATSEPWVNTVITPATKVDQLEERAATTQVKCDSVNDGKHSKKKNDKTARGGESEIKSVPSATCTSDVDMSGNKDKSALV
ncbi:uncharacterized protein LOC111230336 [Seriola dumerili]|uniref:uncharacterized protein LOC111230336 n=1 Tax=Seriola dumerili TaxID=41447 RepID=UPI000BBE8E7E|nr:uncharacterized protein LOC111230336 [Seriola dumerili]